MTSIKCPDVVVLCGRCFGISTLILYSELADGHLSIPYIGLFTLAITQNPRSQVNRRGYHSNPLTEHKAGIMFPGVIYERLYVSADNDKQITITSRLEG